MIRIETVSGGALFEDHSNEWSELVLDATGATPFQTPEWQRTWFRHYGLGKQARGVLVYQGGDLLGLATFVISGGAWRTLRWMGGGPSDYLQPVARGGHEEVVADAISGYLCGVQDADLIDLHQIRENQPLATCFSGQEKIEQATSLVLDLPSTYEEYLATLGKSLRYDVRKLNKEMFSSGRASVRSIGPEELDQGFDTFLEQHKARWRERKLPGAFVGRRLRFHRDWVRIASEKGWLKLRILTIEGKPAGAIYAMQFDSTLYYYQAGFDPEFKSMSPGSLLVADSIRIAIETGCKRFDFMRGDEPYKRRWKPQNTFRNFRLLAAGRGARGQAGLQWNQKAHQVEMKVRSKLERGTPA